MKVLIADGNASCRHELELALGEMGYEVVQAHDGAEARAILTAADAPRLAFLDAHLPTVSGLAVAEAVRASDAEVAPYIILLLAGSADSDADAATAMHAGVDDCLAKPFRRHELLARVRAGRRVIDMQDELATTREWITFQATHDPPTGTLTRVAMIDAFERELVRAGREGNNVAVALIEIDHFEQTNDAYGNAAGDLVLSEVAIRLRDTLRPYDLIGRFGGEEFVAVMPGVSDASAASVAERIRARVGSGPIDLGDASVTITCSVGIAATHGSRGDDATSVLAAANAALYRAKRAGRNRVNVAETGGRATFATSVAPGPYPTLRVSRDDPS